METLETTAKDKIFTLRESIGTVIKGKRETIDLAIVALLAEGHLLIEDVPGVGKTTLGHALARSLDCEFHRIQFTSDLLPSDVLGVSVYSPKQNEFEFKPGPIFANIVLADEINRTTPKTQSALLEAMNEGQVTIENATYKLPRPFMVLATQNPIEHHGTYPLPESQLDRFLMRIEVGYPDAAAEKAILKRYSKSDHQRSAEPVLSPTEVLFLSGRKPESSCGRGPRRLHHQPGEPDQTTRRNRTGSQPARNRGSVSGSAIACDVGWPQLQSFPIIKKLVRPVFEHRLAMMRSGTRTHRKAKTVLQEIIDHTAVPA